MLLHHPAPPMFFKSTCWNIRAVLLLVLCAMGPAHVRGDTLVLPAAADGFIREIQNASQTANATNPLLLVGDTATPNDILRGVFTFDLAAPILQGATIHDVRIDLTINSRDTSNGGSADVPQSILLCPLSRSFDESSVTWTMRDATNPWSVPGADYGAPVATASANPSTVNSGDIIGFAANALRDRVISAIGGSFSCLVRLNQEDSVRSVFRFASGESTTINPPRLLIDYTPAVPPPVVDSPVTPLPGHRDAFLSSRYEVTAGGRPVEVKAERFGFDVAMFTLAAGVATVQIHVLNDFDTHTLKPARHGLAVTRDGNTLSFPLSEPLRLVLEIAGRKPLAIIVTPPEPDPPSPEDPDVIYFGPGTTVAGVIRPAANQTVYLAPGALVRGRIEARNVRGVSVRGRGFLETEGYSTRAARTLGILFENTSDITVEGIAVRSYQTYWQTLFLNSSNIEVAHVNLFGLGVNTDGVDIDGVRDFIVRDSFIRAEDDGLGWHSLDAAANGEPITERAVAERVVIWNTGAGNGVRIGASMETQLWRDITLRHLDILQHAVAGLYSDFSDWAWMRNLRFENITIEKAASPIDFRIAKTIYSNSTGFLDERGHIDGLVFRNVVANGGSVRLAGYDATHRIDRVRFIGCVNGGVPLTSASQLVLNSHVTDVAFNEELPERAEDAPGVYQAEELECRTGGTPQYVIEDPAAGHSRVRIFPAAVPGAFVEHTIGVPAAGRYVVRLLARLGPACGRASLSVNGAQTGPEISFHAAAPVYQEFGFGEVFLPAAGPQNLRLTVTGSDPASTGHQLEVDAFKLLTPLEAWREQHFQTTDAGGPAADLADPDADGRPNLLEFALGTPPRGTQPADVSLGITAAGHPEFTFNRLHPAPLTYVVEASADLFTWSGLAVLPAGSEVWTGPGVVMETVTPSGRSVTVTDGSVTSAPYRRFIRLKVIHP